MKKHIAFCINDSYIDIIPSVLLSFKKFHDIEKFQFHIFINGDLLRLKLVLGDYEEYIIYYEIDDDKASELKECSYLGKSTYYRLYIPSYISQDINTILYIDADIIFNGNIDKLRSMNYLEYPIAGALEATSAGYINCGVILINCDLRRKESISQGIIDYIMDNPDLIQVADQDGINNYLGQNRILYLNSIFNYNIRHSFNIGSESPLIIHFNGKRKPWNIGCYHQLHYKAYKYVNVPMYTQLLNYIIGFIAKVAYFLRFKLLSYNKF